MKISSLAPRRARKPRTNLRVDSIRQKQCNGPCCMLIYVPLHLRPARDLAYGEERTTDSGNFPFKEAKMFCQSCARPLAENLRFCDACGAEVNSGGRGKTSE